MTPSSFPGGTSVSRLSVYRDQCADGLAGGTPHLHTASTEAYLVIGGTGALQTLDLSGFRETELKAGSMVWFTPGIIHRAINRGDLEVPRETEQAIHEQVKRAIDAVGIGNGASHTEVIIGPDQVCSVIEIGARLGAGHIGVLLQHALGINPWAALLDIALGRPAAFLPTRRDYATVRFLTSPRAGRLHSISGLPCTGPGIAAVNVRAAIGQTVDETRTNRERLGHLIVTGSDPIVVETHAQRLLDNITVDVQPDPVACNHPPDTALI